MVLQATLTRHHRAAHTHDLSAQFTDGKTEAQSGRNMVTCVQAERGHTLVLLWISLRSPERWMGSRFLCLVRDRKEGLEAVWSAPCESAD